MLCMWPTPLQQEAKRTGGSHRLLMAPRSRSRTLRPGPWRRPANIWAPRPCRRQRHWRRGRQGSAGRFWSQRAGQCETDPGGTQNGSLNEAKDDKKPAVWSFFSLSHTHIQYLDPPLPLAPVFCWRPFLVCHFLGAILETLRLCPTNRQLLRPKRDFCQPVVCTCWSGTTWLNTCTPGCRYAVFLMFRLIF